MFLQKIRTMFLFEGNVNDDIVNNVLESLIINLEENWKNIITDKSTLNLHLFNKMSTSTVLFFAQELIKDASLPIIASHGFVIDCRKILNGIHFVILTKLNKMLLGKLKRRKRDENTKKYKSTILYEHIDKDNFLNDKIDSEFINEFKDLLVLKHQHTKDNNNIIINVDIKKYLNIMKRFPVIFSSQQIQLLILIYLFALHNDISNSNCDELMKCDCESLIIGN